MSEQSRKSGQYVQEARGRVSALCHDISETFKGKNDDIRQCRNDGLKGLSNQEGPNPRNNDSDIPHQCKQVFKADNKRLGKVQQSSHMRSMSDSTYEEQHNSAQINGNGISLGKSINSFDQHKVSYFEGKWETSCNTGQTVSTRNRGFKFGAMHESPVSTLWQILKNNLSAAGLQIETFKRRSSEFIPNTGREIFRPFNLAEKLKHTFPILTSNVETGACKLQDEETMRHLKDRKSSMRRQEVQFFPFCEEYDGFSVRRTKTISESIQAIEAERRAEEEMRLRQTVETMVSEILASLRFSRDLIKDDVFERVDDQVQGDKISISRPLSYNGVAAKNEKRENNVHLASSLSPSPECYTSTLTEVNNFPKKMPFEEKAVSKPLVSQRLVPNDSDVDKTGDRERWNTEISVITKHINVAAIEDLDHLPYISIELDHFITAEVVKVTIKGVDNLLDLPGTKVNVDTIVKVCRMPKNETNEMKTSKSKGRTTISFDEIFYFEDISRKEITNVAIRFQVYQKRSKMFRKKYLCVGETLVWLDEINFDVKRKGLKIRLEQYLY